MDSWQQVMLGQGLMPERYHSLVDTMPERELADFIGQVKAEVDNKMARLKEHNAYVVDFLSRGVHKADKLRRSTK